METLDISTHIWVDIALGISLGYLSIVARGNRSPLNATIGSRLNQITEIIITNAITAWSTICTDPFIAKVLLILFWELSFSSVSSLYIFRCILEYAANSSFMEIPFCTALSFRISAQIDLSSLEGLVKHAVIWKEYIQIEILGISWLRILGNNHQQNLNIYLYRVLYGSGTE